MTQKVHSAARGLASLGRHGDSTLVHMSPREVQGLQNLALRHGTNLTVNPQTGLPEAFNLGKLLPALGGLALGIVAPELVLPAALGTGAVTKASGGTWGDAISKGFQVYGFGGVGQGLATAGAAAAPTESLASSAGGLGETGTSTVGADLANQAVAAPPPDLASAATNNANFVGYQEGQVAPSLTAGDPGINWANASTPEDLQNLQNLQASYVPDQSYANAAGTPQTVSTPQTSAQLRESLKPENLAKTEENIQDLGASERGQYALEGLKHPTAVYNTMNMGEVAGAGSGLMEGLKEEPKVREKPRPVYYIRKPGGPALYEEGELNQNIAKLGYIPTGEQAFKGQKFNEGVYSYSPVDYKPVDWDKITKPMRKGGLASLASYDGGGTVPQDKGQQILASNQPVQQPQQQTDQGQSPMQNMNQYFADQMASSIAPPSTLNNPNVKASQDWIADFNASLKPSSNAGDTSGGNNDNALENLGYKGDFEAQFVKNYNDSLARWGSGDFTNQIAAKYREEQIAAKQPYVDANGRVVYPTDGSSYWVKDFQVPDVGGQLVSARKHMRTGGLTNLSDSYAAGGKLLRGPGDGMSDSIPAVIGGKKPQRAALADGEFVVPADVVSHLGNGSTEAGSRKLYAMMDKIRKARTGKKKQAPAVKAERYMPK